MFVFTCRLGSGLSETANTTSALKKIKKWHKKTTFCNQNSVLGPNNFHIMYKKHFQNITCVCVCTAEESHIDLE